MEKAYDRVEWGVFLEILRGMGFGERWRSWIFWCRSSAHFSVLLKGSPVGFFNASRRLRLGDPLSPSLYKINAECFSFLLNRVENEGYFNEFQVANSDIQISRLQYVDGTLIFCEVEPLQVSNIARFLDICEATLSPKVNFHKSSMVGISCDGGVTEELTSIMGYKVGSFLVTYLGLPISDSRLSIAVWDIMLERVQAKLDL
ncbi:uncharacterized protein LOC105421769 [Amborella trichopoda]|uniref:uncharacterized protein LOC105421769 n=1 Tax=Amborella trichopoda TaxID=13333 RepID=UPI0005D3A0E1|nr:uncharacterized protein LOC105421769 [Amborella trichopoda]|eukprot:XP_011628775.1 uncharacterized protein LOC105421769 [Amborella trichopoda]